MARRQGPVNFNRRDFMKKAATAGVTCAATEMFSDEFIQAQTAPRGNPARGIELLQSPCPYCGVGYGTPIQVQDGKVVGMVPDKKHPTNRGIQCIKGLSYTIGFPLARCKGKRLLDQSFVRLLNCSANPVK